MLLFIAVHKWKPQDEVAIMKEFVTAFRTPAPKGIKLCTAYSLPQGGYCVWEATSKAALEKIFDQFAPVLKKYTEFVPVTQVYPPTMDYVIELWEQGIKLASK